MKNRKIPHLAHKHQKSNNRQKVAMVLAQAKTRDCFYLAIANLVLCLVSATAFAQSDTNFASLPNAVQVEADRLEYQEANTSGTNKKNPNLLLIGSVVILHQNSKLTAERVELLEKNLATGAIDRTFTATAAKKGLVYFENKVKPTKNNLLPSNIHGQAKTITYNTTSQEFVMTGQAEFWQNKDHLSAGTIRYSALTGRYFAGGTDINNSASSSKPNTRVRILFYPNKK